MSSIGNARILPHGQLETPGIDYGDYQVVAEFKVSEGNEFLISYWHGRMCWAGRGTQSYHNAHVDLWRITARHGDQMDLTQIITQDVVRGSGISSKAVWTKLWEQAYASCHVPAPNMSYHPIFAKNQSEKSKERSAKKELELRLAEMKEILNGALKRPYRDSDEWEYVPRVPIQVAGVNLILVGLVSIDESSEQYNFQLVIKNPDRMYSMPYPFVIKQYRVQNFEDGLNQLKRAFGHGSGS